jgi:peptide deformylase
MAIREVRTSEDEILRKISRKVENVDEKIRELLDDMLETMHKYNGVGLAGPQVGVLKRVVVIDLYDGKPALKLVNPEIVKEKGEQEVEEGCLSFPNEYAKVIRPKEITINALDENGKKIKIVGKDLLAQAISHEIDHLDGVLFVDKMLPDTLEYIEPTEDSNNENM